MVENLSGMVKLRFMEKIMKYFSMFSGIGGFELGIQRAFDNRQVDDRLRGQAEDIPQDSPHNNTEDLQRAISCIGYSEIDKYADQIYQKHFGGKNYGDATKINAGELPDFELLVGGFPCQAFSVAGKRAGFNDTRGTLFFDIARICAEKRPRHLVLENVKGLLSHDSGKTFQTILGVLADLGYFIEWQVCNSKDFGVPQNRERVFIVGHLGGEPRRKVFPIQRTNTKDIKQIIGGGQGNRLYSTSGVSTTLASQAGGQGAKTGLYAIPVNAVNKGEKVRQKGRRFKTHNEPSFTLNTIDAVGVYNNSRIRRLTPLECERLQGFPDNWTEGLSDTQRYKTLGNAVTVNVVEAVIGGII